MLRGSAAAPARGRDLRIDFFRGLALVVIFVDHTRLNWWAHWTPREFGLVSALDAFVLMAGVSGYLAYGSRMGPGQDGLRRLFHRVAVVYAAQLGLVLAMFVLPILVLLVWPDLDVVRFFHLGPLVQDPPMAVLRAALLYYEPQNCATLPVYLVLLPTLPLVVAGMRRSWLWPLGIGVVLFALNVFTGFGLASGNDAWRLDPLRWFVVYAAGVALASRAGRPVRVARPRLWTGLAVAWLLVTLLDDAPWQAVPALAGVPAPTAVLGLDLQVAPWTDVLRLVSLAALVWLVLRWVPRDAGWLRSPAARAVNRMGAASLTVYWLGAVLAIVGSLVTFRLGGTWTASTLVTGVGVLVLLAAGRLQGRRRGRAPAEATVAARPAHLAPSTSWRDRRVAAAVTPASRA